MLPGIKYSLGIELCPPKMYSKLLTYCTCECDFIWKWDSIRYNQVKINTYWIRGWALLRHWCPYEKGAIWTHWKTPHNYGDGPTNQRMPGNLITNDMVLI